MTIPAALDTAGTSATELVERARALVPALRSRQAETDRLSKTPEATVAELEAAGLFSMTLPRIYGGSQASMSIWMEANAELGRGDGGVAWAVTLINACNWMAAGLFPRAVVDEVFSKPNTRVAGVFANRGVVARRVAGGMIVEKGIWFFNSGVYHAQWDILGVPILNDAGEMVDRGAAMVPMSDVKILNDWDTIGLRGSGSSNVAMENVFIPDERIVSIAACTQGRQSSGFDALPHFRTAFAPLMVAILSFPVLGMGVAALEEFMETLPKRDIKLTPYTKQGEAAITHVQVAQADAKVHTAKLLIAAACRDMDAWANTEEYMPVIERARICRDTAVADQLVWEAVDLLGSAGGGSFSRKGNRLSRIWADIKVAGMHPFVSAASNLEMYGRLMCGVEPLLMRV